jgi:hypothetical protein
VLERCTRLEQLVISPPQGQLAGLLAVAPPTIRQLVVRDGYAWQRAVDEAALQRVVANRLPALQSLRLPLVRTCKLAEICKIFVLFWT